jgi:DNA mismatch repair protein MutS
MKETVGSGIALDIRDSIKTDEPGFPSVLFVTPGNGQRPESPLTPAFVTDLHLDQVIEAITAGKEEYDLKPFYQTLLHERDAIQYRQEVFRDLEHGSLLESITSFAQKMRTMREHLAQAGKLYYPLQKQRWFLDAVTLYCDAVNQLLHDLLIPEVHSRGLLSIRDYLARYTESTAFKSLAVETEQIKFTLSSIRYSLHIKENSITVGKSGAEADYSAVVEKTFEKFKQGGVKDYRVKFSRGQDMNHVEAKILDLVALHYPEVFEQLDSYCGKNVHYLDETIARFDREIQFYLSYRQHVERLNEAGLKVCYPEVSNRTKEVYDYDTYDIALAQKLVKENTQVITNDFFLKDQERIIVVTGPNQGGKTTLARTFGQVHYLACLGCPVPGREARLFLFDGLFTHFEKEENIHDLRGKLQDDMIRIHDILERASSKSIILINEIFTSTTSQDALSLSKRILQELLRLDSLCVWVTFIDELSTMSEKTVSMVSTVVPENPAVRTLKVVRKPADGLAYAKAIAEKYHLTYELIKERIRP